MPGGDDVALRNVPVRPAEVVAVGETMVMLTPEPDRTVEDTASFAVHVGGAESNVASSLAGMGVRVRWSSVMRDEPLAHRVVDEIARTGVDTSAVVWGRRGQTGLYLKDPGPGATAVSYYRRGSAARLLSPSLWKDERLRSARILHLSGITAALSSSAWRMLEAAIVDRCTDAAVVSFDVNFRPGLWAAATAAPVLRDLANAADVALVGLDEAEALWGCTSPEEVRAVLPGAGLVVVKDGPVGAYCLERGSVSFAPSPRVDVIEPVGAGDAFAAGFLKGLLDGRGRVASLRLGHLLAAAALRTRGDTTEPPPPEWLERRLGADEDEWRRLTTDGDAMREQQS